MFAAHILLHTFKLNIWCSLITLSNSTSASKTAHFWMQSQNARGKGVLFSLLINHGCVLSTGGIKPKKQKEETDPPIDVVCSAWLMDPLPQLSPSPPSYQQLYLTT